MGIKHVLPFFILCLLWGTLYSQDSPYIQTFPDKLTFRLGLQTTSNSFKLRDKETRELVEFIPNDKSYLGLSVQFRSIGLDIGYAPNFLAENKDNDDSKLITLNFRMFFDHVMQTVDFYKQKGFFVRNQDFTLPVEDLTTTKIGGSTSYIFNEDFSFRAIGFQNEWQKKSAGSFIPRVTYYFTKFQLDDPDVGNLTEHSFNLAVGPGYYYNWIFDENFIVSAGSTAGLGFDVTNSGGKTTLNGLGQLIFRLSGGYNSEAFFSGININTQLLTSRSSDNLVLDDSISYLEFYIGYRFNAPKKWIEKAEEINRKFGLD